MTTLVPTFLKVFVGLRRVAQKAAEGIEALDTVEVVEFTPGAPFCPEIDGVQSGHVKLRNLRTEKVSSHGACVLGFRYLDSVPPPIEPPTELAPLKLTRRPLKAKTPFDATKLKNPKLRVKVTQVDIDLAAADIAKPGSRRTECCVISRALTRTLKARFRRHPDICATTGYGSFTLRPALDAPRPLRNGVKLPPAAETMVDTFDRWTTPRRRPPVPAPTPIEFEVDLTTGWAVK